MISTIIFIAFLWTVVSFGAGMAIGRFIKAGE